MIDFYTWATPNGYKASVTLEELGLPYTLHPIDITKGAQKAPDYLKINPNGKIPAIVDREEDNFAVFESGALMIYLAEKTGRLLPTDRKGRSRVIQWLMLQMSGVGPMQAQAGTFLRFFPEKLPSVIQRYQNETRRLYTVLDTRLGESEYLAGDFSIADIAHWAWIRFHDISGLTLEELPHLQRWLAAVEQRPASQRGLKVPHEFKLP